MKILESSIVNLLDNPRWMDLQVENTVNDMRMLSSRFVEERKWLEDMINFFKDRGGFRKLVLSSGSMKLIEGIVIPEEIRIDVLRSLPNRRDIIMLDEYRGIRYIKTDKRLYVYHDTSAMGNMGYDEVKRFLDLPFSEQEKYLSDKPNLRTYFSADLEKGVIDLYGKREKSDRMTEENYNFFMKVVTYLELTPTVMIVVNGGEKRGDIMRGNLIKNETRSSVIHVNTNWNYKMIRLGSFKVRGHFRFQPCGPNLSQIKLIYIDMYEKGLMKRLSQKELHN